MLDASPPDGGGPHYDDLPSARNATLYVRFGKRAVDVAGSGLVLLVSWPFLAVIAAAVRLTLGSPVLFRQRRPGFMSRPFTILKFRTMRDLCDEAGRPLPDRERLTGLGRFLRATSLDELPEFINVFTGDMSLVGPRPLLMEYLDRYSVRQARRHDARPGITGLAQVSGRNALSWERRFELDIEYALRCSFGLDVRILFLTLVQVVRRRGISQPGHATADEFRGSAWP